MRRSVWSLGIVLASAVTLQVGADDKPQTKPKSEPKEKLVAAGQYTGKLMKPPGTDRTLTLSIPLGRKMSDLQLPVQDEILVRALLPPPQFDDKGKLKKYTKKELDDLKGPDKKLPGYTATLEDLRQGQTVTVHLARKAGTPPKVSKKEELPPEYKPQVNMIVIVRDVPQK